MENDSRIGQWADKIKDSIEDQEWYRQLKTKWEELDPQSRIYLKLGSAISIVLIVLVSAISFIWSVHSLKVELNEKSELLSMISNANDELRRLKESNAMIGAGGISNEPWGTYLANLAAPSGIPREGVTVSEEKKGASNDQTKESLLDVSMKHVNIRQLARYALTLESSPRPVKLRNLMIDTQPDLSGYLDATLSVSGFSLVTK